jgi:hypothetical protein
LRAGCVSTPPFAANRLDQRHGGGLAVDGVLDEVDPRGIGGGLRAGHRGEIHRARLILVAGDAFRLARRLGRDRVVLRLAAIGTGGGQIGFHLLKALSTVCR